MLSHLGCHDKKHCTQCNFSEHITTVFIQPLWELLAENISTKKTHWWRHCWKWRIRFFLAMSKTAMIITKKKKAHLLEQSGLTWMMLQVRFVLFPSYIDLSLYGCQTEQWSSLIQSLRANIFRIHYNVKQISSRGKTTLFYKSSAMLSRYSCKHFFF